MVTTGSQDGDGLLHLLSATQAGALDPFLRPQQPSGSPVGSTVHGRRSPPGANIASTLVESAQHQQVPVANSGRNALQGTQPTEQPQQEQQTSKAWRTYQCNLCERSYERADHLQRHLKSHENTRPYACALCPQRFNRADLLSRHQASHDRDGRPASNTAMKNGKTRSRIQRLCRAGAACVHCVTSKTKCQDQKPCSRCVRRNLNCKVIPMSGNAHRHPSQTDASNIEARASISSDSDALHSWQTPPQTLGIAVPADDVSRDYSINEADNAWRHSVTQDKIDDSPSGYYSNSNPSTDHEKVLIDADDFLQMSSYPNLDLDFGAGFGFMPRDAYLPEETGLAMWDFDFDGLELAYENLGQDPIGLSHLPSSSGSQPSLQSAASKRHAAFERSAWIWKPTNSDQALNDHNDLHLDEESIPSVFDLASGPGSPDESANCSIDSSMRDQIISLLSRLAKDNTRNIAFPSLNLVNEAIRVYFTRASSWTDSMIHSPSFNGSKALPQLNIAIIAAGASLISIPAVWKMGMALQETVRLTVGDYWEQNNSNTRNLQALQAFVIGLDMGLWSGFKRKMEIAESFGQPVVAILRRTSAFTATRTPEALVPTMNDSEAVLNSKWNIWAERESFKRLVTRLKTSTSIKLRAPNRLVLHLFVHDVFASVGLQKPPLISFTELKLDLPCPIDLWRASTAKKWRDIYIETRTPDHPLPTFMEALRNPKILLIHDRQVNMHLSTSIILHGFWGQIWNNLEARKYYAPSSATHRLCLLTSQAELQRDLQRFASHLPQLTKGSAEATMLCELFMMILDAPPNDLQRFAGRFGEGEASNAAEEFKEWVETPDARHAVWHAGQVFKAASLLNPTHVRGFNSIALYYATLTLWVFGLVSTDGVGVATQDVPLHAQVTLNEAESLQSHLFKSENEGVAGLAVVKAGSRYFVPLHDADRVLEIARDIYRANFPLQDEPLPPLTAGLSDLLKELGSLSTRQTTRAHTAAL